MKNKFGNVFIFFAIAWFVGCTTRTGELLMQGAPETKLFLTKINLPDSLRLAGQIKLYWYGEAKNGYIKSYDFAFDNQPCGNTAIGALNWVNTPKSDSSFLLPLPTRVEKADITFYVRAIDNMNQTDPTPACLVVPVINTAPTLSLTKTSKSKSGALQAVTDSVHSIFSIEWTADDAEGAQYVDSIYIKINNSDWTVFPANINQLIFMPDVPEAVGTTSCSLLANVEARALQTKIQGLNVKANNKIYVKSRDINATFSKIDSTNTFFVKQKVSDLLVIDSYKSNLASEKAVLSIVGLAYASGYNYYNFNTDNDAYVPKYWGTVFYQTLKQYKKVIWFNEKNFSVSSGTTDDEKATSIEVAADAIQKYLNGGGRMFIASVLPANGSTVYSFAPFTGISTATGTARINKDSTAYPVDASFLQLNEVLTCTGIITGATPGYVKETAKPLLKVKTTSLNGWSGPNDICAYTIDSQGKANLIFFSTNIYNFTLGPLQKLFDVVLNDKFK
ncbi:MAG: hypothetical protein NW207_03655 [Cytophagales bacterium]|nr:hypothetical protein [Cytophagales bacterium]